jgi:serine/threonine protein kinase
MSAEEPDGGLSHEADFAAMWSSDGATRSLSPTATGTALPADLPFLFAPGQRFGPYLIVRPLGKGGMGQVYEAEETESGRRVAVKILSRGLGDDEERERFLREGQLAASLSHPNTVYVFGTTEVQGFPVIAMELAPGGTLKDLVVDGPPLTPAAAVDAIVQVIGGLEAAAALGVLPRVALLYTLPVAMLVAGAVWAWRHPSRGIQDRIAGTWIVPR